MGDITKNFSYSEFYCKSSHHIPENIKVELVKLANNLQVLRDYFHCSITITSGYRDPAYNAMLRRKSKNVAGKSQHIFGKAADIKIKGYTPKMVHAKIEQLIAQGKIQEGGLGLYDTWVHYDIRDGKARWHGK